MYLIDTSVWIDYFREKNNNPVRYFLEILDNKIPFGITGIIYQEILQGAKTLDDFKRLNVYLASQSFFHPKDSITSFHAAAKLYFQCRKKGFTLRSTIDCLIAQVAIEHDLILLHNDEDYRNIKRVEPSLKLADI